MRIIGGGARWLDEPLGQNIGGLEPLGPHEVGAYGLYYSFQKYISIHYDITITKRQNAIYLTVGNVRFSDLCVNY